MKTKRRVKRTMTRAMSLLSVGLLAVAGLGTQTLQAQTRVDLRSQQTPLKNQGGRGTCIVFAAVAALEAAYKRSGYGTLDLSEEFCNYLGKTFWLHENWNNRSKPVPIGLLGANRQENQVGAFGGGGGPEYLRRMVGGLAIPLDREFPYRTSKYVVPANWDQPYWYSQWNTNTYNLDQTRLPRRALTAGRYYSPASFTEMSSSDARNPAKIEAILRAKKEVVWDFRVGGTRPKGIWTPTNDKLSTLGGHSMLIVGYDRRNSNSKYHYFIVKNSWGSVSATTSGYTLIRYDYLRRYGYGAGYINSVRPPKAWPELGFVGRWNLAFDGHRGTLDIYHIPGIHQSIFGKKGVWITDRRLGVFYDSKGVAHRVNGNVRGNRIEFWFKSKNPNMRWDELREKPTLGRKFVYYMINPTKGEMAGYHQDNAGLWPIPAWGGYARMPRTIKGTDGFLRPFLSAHVNKPEQYLGRWYVAFDRVSGYLNVLKRNDLLLSSTLRSRYAGLQCEFVESGSNRRSSFVALVLKSRPAQISFNFTHGTRNRVSITGYHLSWQRGVFGGVASSRGTSAGVYGYRIGGAFDGGYIRRVGTGCAGSNKRVLTHTVSGNPSLGELAYYKLANGPSYGGVLLVTGLRPIPGGLSLGFLGSPSCRLYSDIFRLNAYRLPLLGNLSITYRVPNDRRFKGVGFYTQFAADDRGRLISSNGYYTRIGGSK